jgi:hypothetical protein
MARTLPERHAPTAVPSPRWCPQGLSAERFAKPPPGSSSSPAQRENRKKNQRKETHSGQPGDSSARAPDRFASPSLGRRGVRVGKAARGQRDNGNRETGHGTASRRIARPSRPCARPRRRPHHRSAASPPQAESRGGAKPRRDKIGQDNTTQSKTARSPFRLMKHARFGQPGRFHRP